VRGALLGAGGAALMDAWALLARRAFNVQGGPNPPPCAYLPANRRT
jgi:hypothetical protein